MRDETRTWVKGFLKIYEPEPILETCKIYFDGPNSIHYENMSIALAESLANEGSGPVYMMVFGNGGTTVDPTGIITYLTPNNTGTNAGLYHQTYAKVVNDRNANNIDPTRNRVEVRHVTGKNYTDIFITCLLDYGEPNGQEAFDNASSNTDFVFDELGIVSYDPNNENGVGRLLTHVIFHPVQKSLNRLIQIDYTIRIQSLTGLSEVQ